MRQFASLIVLSLMFAVAVPLRAQSGSASVTNDSTTAVPTPIAEPNRDAAAPAVPVTGASMTGLRAGVHAPETSRANDPFAQPFVQSHQNLGQSTAMMIVGVAALVAGAVIGGTPGTLIMVGGAVIGLVGLYDYLK